MFEKLSDCPSCQSTNLQNHMICKDHSISQEDFALVKCQDCNLVFTNPRPDLSNINRYYQSDQYISHSNQGQGLLGIVYKLVRWFALKNKLRLISKLSSTRSLLDYGCGTGYFLKTAINSRWSVEGVEPNKTARDHANDSLPITVSESLSEINQKKKFSIITLWHVLEHVHDLNLIFNELIQRLDKKGKIILALPNHKSLDAQHFSNYWAGYDVPRHLYHFDQHSIKSFTKRHGMKVERVLPMKFDSYYVSFLSNKYKFCTNKYFISIINGYKSNSYGQKTGDYSSLIYILTK